MHLSDCFLELFTFIRFLADSPEMADAEYDAVHEDVSKLIERLEQRADKCGFAPDLFDKARFAVFAWVDEAVLCSSWSGTRQWLRHPLQREYYGTTNAGEEFFERLDMLLDGNHVPVDESLFADLEKDSNENAPAGKIENANSEVLEVYTLCLSLGYTGKYFSESDTERLDKLRNDCIARIMGKQGGNGLAAFPAAYGTGEKALRTSQYGRVFDPLSIVFIVLPVLVVAGVFFAYRGLLEYSLNLWLG
ncbi:DotU family type IV/VI secretion system protein [Maridesulfovibrio hydrothermalis]|uniref:Type IV / VI secretion system protein, DotU family n=1 Tax=Maridesulfovibrio hydrothermalis AM13 = DSM 14728 TaxID=1121451 RepID=L0RBJ7_9BACT|nr:DotU family type IV/VI secretion system protein [Maridesulfovibrio hydrothermalis]CCO24168.1 Type IV / VI secretion system protein, DotU family [Maridesulfovibrio hydrothermalis AM13 = DSM 14728]